MQIRYTLLLFFLASCFSINLSAQTEDEEVIFIITNEGDSILTYKIYGNKTNEDQVTFSYGGKRTTYQASEIKSYFKKNRKHSIFIPKENHHKLVQILLRGKYKLAKSYSAEGDEKFYLLVDTEWHSLDAHAFNLNERLTTLLPDIDQFIGNKKTHYNARSLGKVMAEYSKLKDPGYRIVGYPDYTDRFKLGGLGSIGLSTVDINNVGSANFGTSLGFNLGLGAEISYSRLFSVKIQLAYSQNKWDNGLEIFKLKTTNFTPLLSCEFFRPSRNFGLSVSVGPNIILAKNLSIDAVNDNANLLVKLTPINLGYDFQLGASIGRNLEAFLSYQTNSIKSQQRGVGSRDVNLKLNAFRAGVIYGFVYK